MFSDPLTLKYLLLAVLAIWGVFTMLWFRRGIPAYLLGILTFLAVAYLALGSGFSIRIPYFHQQMEVLVYSVHENRVHALAQPLDQPGEPIHIVFSIDPKTNSGVRMRESFFKAVREREEDDHRRKLIINMRGYMTEQGEQKYESPETLPPKIPR